MDSYNRLLGIWWTDLSDEIKRNFSLGSIRVHVTIWMLKTFIEKKVDSNCTRILRAVMKNSWKQHPTKQQLYGLLPPLSKPIHVRRTRHAQHCQTSKYELISDIFHWNPSHGRTSVERTARTYQHQLCENIGCSLNDLLKAMDDRDEWQGRVREICHRGTTWWWWWWWWHNVSFLQIYQM